MHFPNTYATARGYPCILYHRFLPARVVGSDEEWLQLGPEWSEWPREGQWVLDASGVPIGGVIEAPAYEVAHDGS